MATGHVIEKDASALETLGSCGMLWRLVSLACIFGRRLSNCEAWLLRFVRFHVRFHVNERCHCPIRKVPSVRIWESLAALGVRGSYNLVVLCMGMKNEALRAHNLLSEKGNYASGAREDILVLIILGSGSSNIYSTCAWHSQGVACAAYPLNIPRVWKRKS